MSTFPAAYGERAERVEPSSTVCVIGLGQIGSSLCAALKRRRAARVIGVDRDPATVRSALRLRIVDEAATGIDAASRADIVVLAAPVRGILGLIRPVSKLLRRNAVLTDVGSTKEAIVRAAPAGLRFVPGHPMAGGTTAGIAGCDPDLFRGLPWLLLPGAGRAAVARMVSSLGARPVFLRSGEEHDRLMADASHLPHLIAYALMRTRLRPEVTGGSWRDATRVALSDPRMVLDFLLTNRHLRRSVERFVSEIRLLSRAPERTLRKALGRARRTRSALP